MNALTPHSDRTDLLIVSPAARSRLQARARQTWVEALGSWLARRVEAFRAWQLRQRTISELRALDDRLLTDIGLHRSEIRSVAEDVVTQVQAQASVPSGRTLRYRTEAGRLP